MLEVSIYKSMREMSVYKSVKTLGIKKIFFFYSSMRDLDTPPKTSISA